jgi:hypothetical protein
VSHECDHQVGAEVEASPAVHPESPRGHECWDRLVPVVLEDAIAHLQQIIFDDRWAEIRAASPSDEEALRESLRTYEQGLGDLFGFVRMAGMAGPGLAWSRFKTEVRRAARATNEEISLRTARDEALYRVERFVEPGDQQTYLLWSSALMHFLHSHTGGTNDRPPASTSDDERLAWALAALTNLDEPEGFHAAFLRYTGSLQPAVAADLATAIALQTRLVREPRFDLVLNIALRWLAACP